MRCPSCGSDFCHVVEETETRINQYSKTDYWIIWWLRIDVHSVMAGSESYLLH